MIFMSRCKALVVAAGAGTRAGLPYPKTLHPVQGRPILLRILDLLAPYDPEPTVVVSPSGRPLIEACLSGAGRRANLIEQDEPRGMGDAVLRFDTAPGASEVDRLILIWGDLPFIQPETLAATVLAAEGGATLAFPTRCVDRAYTRVTRDPAGRVTDLVETREAGLEPTVGERDIGVFVFDKAPVFDLLRQPLPDRLGGRGLEHGFLYVVRHLSAAGLPVEALPVATDLDLISLNQLSDLDGFT
ncbi:MAG: bifunctional UDP-N-acetylglucosamine pyrophosphorylase/glucosamine-1-phosphate N-acetyltransferase [Brevundimonas sp.]|jgi:bifunctional UDP-N-acetylglucosamine pyrophosphorylase/glucosamine-1-phosphate N-acetyltransferase